MLQRPRVQKVVSSLSSELNSSGSVNSKRDAVLAHIESVKDDEAFQLEENTELPQDRTWYNISAPSLSLSRDLSGKVTVLDFFTYCCINCMHILPDLHQLEETYSDKDGLVVIGVHSAKFAAERVPENILNAVLRYDITHPVVNDSDIMLWNKLGVSCWPTLVVLGPDNRLLYYIIGEGHSQELSLFLDVAIGYYKDCGLLNSDSVGVLLERDKQPLSVLRFPGKVCYSSETQRLYVSDSSHNRILVVHPESGEVEQVFGSGRAGLQDGEAVKAEFNGPQGLEYFQGDLFIADTLNHAIRKVDVSNGQVTTIAGTGGQGKDRDGGRLGTNQEISSPWDVCIGSTKDADHPNVLFIAMAGMHQIWVYLLEDSQWSQGKLDQVIYPQGTVKAFAGSGEESNKNNSFPHKAGFAQPSGITMAKNGDLFVADSESSTLRAVSMATGAVKGLVGGALDPMDLFACGDIDGKGRSAKLQHPLGVAWSSHNHILYVADSYNHKIKQVDLSSKFCSTLAGTGSPGLTNGSFGDAQFYEPGGICVGPMGNTLFIADTNNHSIRVVDLVEKTVSKLNVHFKSNSCVLPSTNEAKPKFTPLTRRNALRVKCESAQVRREGGELNLSLSVTPPIGCSFHAESESMWQLVDGHGWQSKPARGHLPETGSVEINVTFSSNGEAESSSTIEIELHLFYCAESKGVCLSHQVVLLLPLLFVDTCQQLSSHAISYIIPQPTI